MKLNFKSILAKILVPFLQQDDEKVSEKNIEILFNVDESLTVKFKQFIFTEFFSANQTNSISTELTNNQLKSIIERKEEIHNKLLANSELSTALVKAFKHSREKIIVDEKNEEIDDSGWLCI